MRIIDLNKDGNGNKTTQGWEWLMLAGSQRRGGLVVGRRTCDLVVAGSRPGRDAAA